MCAQYVYRTVPTIVAGVLDASTTYKSISDAWNVGENAGVYGGLPNVVSKKCVIAATSAVVVARRTGCPVGDGNLCGGFARSCEMRLGACWRCEAVCKMPLQKCIDSLVFTLAAGRKIEKKSRCTVRVEKYAKSNVQYRTSSRCCRCRRCRRRRCAHEWESVRDVSQEDCECTRNDVCKMHEKTLRFPHSV